MLTIYITSRIILATKNADRMPSKSTLTATDMPARRNAAAQKSTTSLVLTRIESLVSELRPSEATVARYVLTHPNQVVGLSFPDIAQRTGVSQPTVARFCRAAGYSGYRDFKLRLAQSLAKGVPFVHRDVSAEDSMAEVGAKVVDRAIAALLTLRNHLDPNALERATDLLASARRIEFHGVGNSGIVATDAQHKFFRLGAPAIAYADPHVQAMAASLLGKTDVLVVISSSGRSEEIVRSAEIAKESGAHVIAITTNPSPLARIAHIALFAESSEDLDVYAPMTSRLVQLAIIDVLAVGVAIARGPALASRLARAKAVVAKRKHIVIKSGSASTTPG